MTLIKTTKKIPKWLPDWRDERAYLALDKNTSREKWAWEFMRRNPKYQFLYRNGRRHFSSWYKKNVDNKNFYKYFICKPKAIKNDSYAEYLHRCKAAGITPTIKSKRREILDKFPVLTFSIKLKPDNPEPPDFNTDYNYPHMYIAPDYEEEFSYDIQNDDEVFMVFSSALSIDDQINKARDLLKVDQKEYKEQGNDVSDFLKLNHLSLKDYLRYLDAELNGHTPTEIAMTIHPTAEKNSAVQKVSKGLKKAKEYRDGGYLRLLGTVLLT
ncbi:MAG: DUF6499 domain-containing protein [Bacteroidales bacterium]|nr:DUF6499 domain-containing protein [Bacteroidales bacterium]